MVHLPATKGAHCSLAKSSPKLPQIKLRTNVRHLTQRPGQINRPQQSLTLSATTAVVH